MRDREKNGTLERRKKTNNLIQLTNRLEVQNLPNVIHHRSIEMD